MAPPARTWTRPRAANPRRKPKRTDYKKQKMKRRNCAIPPAASIPTKEDLASISSPSCSSTCLKVNGLDDPEGVGAPASACSTPRAERYRIPEVTTCPPAPKKPRMVPNCSIQRTRPIAFFAPPDLELFFFYALRNIPV